MDSTASEPLYSSLALALSGFAVSAATEQSLPLAQGRGARHGRLGAVTCGPSVTPLVQHARQLVDQLVAAPSAGGFQQHAEQLEGLCFALRSTLGLNGRLPEQEESDIWRLSTQLWEASLGRPDEEAQRLAALAKEMFELIENDCDRSEECAAFLSFFAKMASSWAKQGQPEQARWCIERAMRYSEQLEAMLQEDEVPRDSQERCVVQLFMLYVEASKNALDTKQQALARNLMSRAVQLSRHDAVSPSAAVSMAISITQLQLQQAEVLGANEPMLAVALLTAAYQQLTAAELPTVVDPQLRQGVKELKQEVLLRLCKAHLQVGDAQLALKCMENAGLDGGDAASLAPDVQLMAMRVKLDAGRLTEALQFLAGMMGALDLSGEAPPPNLHTWLAALKLALPSAHLNLPAFQSAVVTGFVWKATSRPESLLKLLQALLGVDQGPARQCCQRMALDALALEEVAASIHKDVAVQQQCHGLLWHKASQLFASPDLADASAARDLFSAALQYAQPGACAKNARMLSACHARLGQHQRASEYTDIAARHEQQPSSATQLLRLQACVNTGSHAKAVEVIRSLSCCQDFHPSCVATACAAAAAANDPTVPKEAAALAVNVYIKPDSSSSIVPAGEEARLLIEYISAIRQCAQALQPGSPEAAALHKELAAAMRLATKRLTLLSADKFAGKKQVAALEALARHAYNGGLQAYSHSAHEPCVVLMSSSCMLLKELDAVQRGRGSVVQQAQALMVAVQALLDLHASAGAPDRANKLLLAQKLLAKVQELVAAFPAGQHTGPRQRYLALAIAAASRVAEEAGSVSVVEALLRDPSPVPAALCKHILAQLSLRKGPSKLLRAAMFSLVARCMLSCSLAEGLELAVAAAQASPSPDHLSQLLAACCQKLRAGGGPAAAGSSLGQQTIKQWLVSHAWNRGMQLSRGGQAEQGTLLRQLALEMLRAGGLPAELAQAQQLEEGLASAEQQARGPDAGADAAAMVAAAAGATTGAPALAATDHGSMQGRAAEPNGMAALTGMAAHFEGRPTEAEAAGNEEPVMALIPVGSRPAQPASVGAQLEHGQPVSAAVLSQERGLVEPGGKGGPSPAPASRAEAVASPTPAAASLDASAALGCGGRSLSPAPALAAGTQDDPLGGGQPSPVSAGAGAPGAVEAGPLDSQAPQLSQGCQQQGLPPSPLKVGCTSSQSSGELSDSSPEGSPGVTWLDAIAAAQKRCEGRQQAAMEQQRKQLPVQASRAAGGSYPSKPAAFAHDAKPQQGIAAVPPSVGSALAAAARTSPVPSCSADTSKGWGAPQVGAGVLLGTDGAEELSLEMDID